MSAKCALYALLVGTLLGSSGATATGQVPGPGTAPAQNPAQNPNPAQKPSAQEPPVPAGAGAAAPQGGTLQSPAGQPAQGTGGANPFFDTTPTKPPQAEKPKPKWPSLKQRLARTSADYIGRTYLCQEAAYIGYYEINGVRVAGFRVPERRQMVYMRIGDVFWNGEIRSITPKQVSVRYREEPDSKPRERQMSRQSYAKGLVNAMDEEEMPAGSGTPPPATRSGGASPVPPTGVGIPPNEPGATPEAPQKKKGK